MGVSAKTHASCYGVVIQHPEYAKMMPLWMLVSGKAKSVVRLQPTVVGISPAV